MIIQNTNTNQVAPPTRHVSSDAPKVVADTSKQAAPQQPSSVQLKNAVDVINLVMQQSNHSLEFSVDTSTKMPIVKVTDTETGALIRQIPSEETLAISHSIDQFLEQHGLLLKQKA